MMASFLGPIGSLIGFRAGKSLEISAESRSTYRTTLGGARKEQRGPRGRRAWEVSLSLAKPSEVAMLAALVDGFYGPPPWVWVDPWAKVTNLLSPEAAILSPGTYGSTGVTVGGAGVTADGLRFGRSINIGAGVEGSLHRRNGTFDRLPVIAGTPVTAAFYASGTGGVRVQFINSAGTQISLVDGPSTSGTWTRRTHTLTPPAGAVSAQILTYGVTSETLTTFTWTNTPSPWSHGKGCNRVTVDGLAEAVQYASEADPNLRRSTISFTVNELG